MIVPASAVANLTSSNATHTCTIFQQWGSEVATHTECDKKNGEMCKSFCIVKRSQLQ